MSAGPSHEPTFTSDLMSESVHDFSRYNLVILATVGLFGYLLAIWQLKLWAYPGWKWASFLGDIKTVLGFASLLLPLIVIFWRALKGKKPDESIIEVLQHTISLRSTLIIAFILLVIDSALLGTILTFGEREPSPELLTFVSESDWANARQVLASLPQEKLRFDVWQTLELYEGLNEATDMEHFGESQEYRADRNLAEHLMGHGSDLDIMNSLSFAEASKAIFVVEGSSARPVLNDGTRRLQDLLPTIRTNQQKAIVLHKLGEILLYSKDYSGAETYLRQAAELETRPSQKALILSRLGNALAALGKTDKALDLYRKAEHDYPEPRKHVFYSNFGYFLLQAKQYDEAEAKVKQALANQRNDWITNLNLALVYDANNKPEDAYAVYDHVIAKADANSKERVEALILKGRAMELRNKPLDDFLPLYLEASGRVPSPDVIEEMRKDPLKLANLYEAMAKKLDEGNTQGIEEYINWFRGRSKQLVAKEEKS